MTPACIRRVLGDLEVREALDVGCGSGEFTRVLAYALPGARTIVGIDPDKDSIDEARRITDDRRVRYRVLGGEEMPFAEHRFDLVAISNALHHVANPLPVLAAMRRVLAHDGSLVVQEVVSEARSPAERAGRDVHHFKARIDRAHGRTHRNTYASEGVRRLLEQADAVIEAECELTDTEPAAPGSERVADAMSFLGEYLEFARGRPDFEEYRREASRIGLELVRSGIADPPRIVIRARFRPRP
ncbi:MAG: class I SAM-dependent methyltransferase [Spirochaetota bacterium]